MGHTRLTQTKGVWLWGEPVPVQLPSGETTNVGVDAAACIKLCAKACMPKPVCPCLAIPMAVASLATPWQAAIAVLQMPHVPLSLPALPWHSLVPLPQLQLLFIDTEGFESTGKADVYDDRIFALSALMSQVRCSTGRQGAWKAIRVLGRQAGCWAGRRCACQRGAGRQAEGAGRQEQGAGEQDRGGGGGSRSGCHPGVCQGSPDVPCSMCRESLHLIAANSTAVGLPQVGGQAG